MRGLDRAMDLGRGASRIDGRRQAGPHPAFWLAPLLLLAACQGPNEKAGEEKDKAAAAANGQAYQGDGPNERIGASQDRAADAAEDAREAKADALKKQARDIKAQADLEADKLEQQAEAIRDRAKDQAKPLEAQAKQVREQK